MSKKLTENEWYLVSVAGLIIGATCMLFGIWLGTLI